MASTVSTVADPLAARLIKHTADTTTVTAEDNVRGAAPTIYGIQLENLGTTAAYFKADESTNATASSSTEELKLYAPAGTTVSYLVGTGHAHATGLSYWITTTSVSGSAQTAPSDSVTVKILTS